MEKKALTRTQIYWHPDLGYLVSRTVKNKFLLFVRQSMVVCHSSLPRSFPGGSDSKESACNAGDPGLNPGVRKIPCRREWLPTSVFLPGEFQGQRSLVGYNSWSCKESDMTEQLTLFTHTYICVCVYTYIHFFLPLWLIKGYWIYFPVLYSRILLWIHSVYNSLHLLLPNS